MTALSSATQLLLRRVGAQTTSREEQPETRTLPFIWLCTAFH
jgi:hypothetical protein